MKNGELTVDIDARLRWWARRGMGIYVGGLLLWLTPRATPLVFRLTVSEPYVRTVA